MNKNVRWLLTLYDAIILIAIEALLLIFAFNGLVKWSGILLRIAISFTCVFVARFVGNVYKQIWRYGGIQCYIRLLVVDACAFFVNLTIEVCLPIDHVPLVLLLAVFCLNTLLSLSIRMLYRYTFKCGNESSFLGKTLLFLLRAFTGIKVTRGSAYASQKIKVAIVGAGTVGVALVEELLSNSSSIYRPRCFIDIDKEKAGRRVHNIPVILEDETTVFRLEEYEIKEIIFAIPDLAEEAIKSMCVRYVEFGYKTKIYDYPVMRSFDSKRQLREFNIEDLLFRKPIAMHDERTVAYYKDKVVLITGGGGSIGSELCRQLAKMQPKSIIVLDIYENGAYDVQQELMIVYGKSLDVHVEIASITNRKAMERVFREYSPQIVINAAAHKHVPLMENNCIEAVENNVFGTKTIVDLCEEFGAERFMMVSTDKAVNPTNVMGATKRMCEMIVQSASTVGNVKYSATRFGNVLGSAGSVIPLFRRQIANGGPITLTDKRIIRYFMTIPEASQLVLQSGAMANNGEIFVLDMGQPIKIYDLAKNMLRLSGAKGIEIVETGLRPGEKLYEELLVKTEELDKTENNMIFIERDIPLATDEIEEKLSALRAACQTDDDNEVRKTLKLVVPTYRSPEEINSEAENADEMKNKRELANA